MQNMTDMLMLWTTKHGSDFQYGEDQDFLGFEIWPKIENDQIAHDSYCCQAFPNAHPYPSKRAPNHQHVGQVFDGLDVPREGDKVVIRNNVSPESCRKEKDWLYG